MEPKNLILEKIQEAHDRAISNLQNGSGPEISNFSGVQINQNGLSFEVYKEISSRIALYSKQKADSVQALPKDAIILQKDFATNLFKKLDHFMFKHIDGGGYTLSEMPSQVMQIRDEDDTISSLGFFCLFASFVIGSIFLIWICFDFSWIRMIYSLSSFALWGISLKVINILIAKEERKLNAFYKETDRLVLLKSIFSDHHDFTQNRFDSRVRTKITFPDPKNVRSEIGKTLQYCAKVPNSQPLIVAHWSAIGVEVDARDVFKAMENDPFIGLETESFIVIFPSTQWGNIAEEQKMLDQLKLIFGQTKNSYELFKENHSYKWS